MQRSFLCLTTRTLFAILLLCAIPAIVTPAVTAAEAIIEEVDVVVEEDIRYDKTRCDPGPHEVDAGAATVAPDVFTVHWKTTSSELEDVVVEVHREYSPIGVDRFYNLLLDNYYNCATFFRVVPNFVVQFGIASDPMQTKKWKANIQDDAEVLLSNTRGTISYAKSGSPNSRNFQVFINLEDNSSLDAQGFTAFGSVVSGMAAVDAVFDPTNGNSGGISQSTLSDKGNTWVLEKYPEIDMIENTAIFTGPAKEEP